MTKCKLMIKKGLVVLAAAGFFGFLYPELCMLENTCRVVCRNVDAMETSMEMSMETSMEETLLVPEGSELYYKLLSAEPEEIKIKSRLFEILAAYFEKDEK